MKDDKELIRKYSCPACGFEFESRARKVGKGHKAVSNHIKCPRCQNGVRTWE